MLELDLLHLCCEVGYFAVFLHYLDLILWIKDKVRTRLFTIPRARLNSWTIIESE